LKHLHVRGVPRGRVVAPRAGAWIETVGAPVPDIRPPVAPRAGAWIETMSIKIKPLRTIVAPRAGAWIETYRVGGS